MTSRNWINIPVADDIQIEILPNTVMSPHNWINIPLAYVIHIQLLPHSSIYSAVDKYPTSRHFININITAYSYVTPNDINTDLSDII